MSRNPFYNAFAAASYIIGVVSATFLTSNLVTKEESVLFPIGVLSVLVLSVAVMAYLFFYQPILMLLDGKRDEAAKLFLHTLGTFAAITAVVLLISLLVNR